MSRLQLISVTCASAIVALLATGLRHGALTPRPALTEVTRSATWVDDAKGSAASRRSRKRDVEEVRRKLAQGATGTYITDVLFEHDSALARGPDRVEKPLRIWIDPAPPLEGWNPEFEGQVRNAFQASTDTDIPMRFIFVADSTDAD